jgi:hypothetical protein
MGSMMTVQMLYVQIATLNALLVKRTLTIVYSVQRREKMLLHVLVWLENMMMEPIKRALIVRLNV